MITIICGLIGSGKSTYAAEHFDFVTESENGLTKPMQVAMTERYNEQEHDVAHVTCYPTIEELKMICDYPDTKLIWIDTSPAQCHKNVIERGRKRDVEDMNYVDRENKELYTKLVSSQFRFKKVHLFDDGERW